MARKLTLNGRELNLNPAGRELIRKTPDVPCACMLQDPRTGVACGKPATGSMVVNVAPKSMYPMAKYTFHASIPTCDICAEIIRRVRDGGTMRSNGEIMEKTF